MLHVYTGDGKGKTTAALGMALRALGHGWRVVMIQFMKGWDFYGEIASTARLSGFELLRTGTPDYVYKEGVKPVDVGEAARGMALARERVAAGACELLILDEICVAVDYGLLDKDETVAFIRSLPESLEVVLTGRYAPPEFLERADYITEMREIRHPYQKGIPSREGVEF